MNSADRARHERDLLAAALSDLLVALGYEAPAPPRLLEVAAEAAAHARQPSLLDAS
jgi:hypothetical protein